MSPIAATEIPSLSNLLTNVGGGGLVIGALIGFALPAPTTRALAENVVLVGTLGYIVGSMLAFVIRLAATAAGG